MEENKKIKNMVATIILLGGLVIGSLFVDVAQIIRGSGFSEKNLSKTEIFESAGKTWVAYTEPMVTIKVISDELCEKCDPGEALVWLRRVTPTINAQKVNFDSTEGKQLIDKFGIKTLPAFVFSSEIAKTDFYSQAKILFNEKDEQFSLNTQELGLLPGKYLELPKINDSDPIFGNKDAKVKVVVFSDFQCPYCKMFWTKALRELMTQYKDSVVFDYKHLPLDFHPQANNAALASQCALEQNKFWEYGDKLIGNQAEWSNLTGTQKFKEYAKDLKFNIGQFDQCLDSAKYQEKVDEDKKIAENFGISGTPATFINGQFKNGVISQDELKAALDEEVQK